MKKMSQKRGAALLAKHASPYVPTLDVHEVFAVAPRDQGGDADTELKDHNSFSSLSPVVWVSPAFIAFSLDRERRKSASPQVEIVQESAAAAVVDLGFWDGATTVTPVSVEQRSHLGDAIP
jgi:hypothetical protein